MEDLTEQRIKYLEKAVEQQQEIINLFAELLKLSEKARSCDKGK